MTPSVRYAHTTDGVDVAYWSIGDGPPLIVTPFNPYSHIELEWQNPAIRQWYEGLAEFATVVRYDSRGTGLSTRHVPDVSLEAMYRDLCAVTDAVGGDSISLIGVFHTGPAALLFASRQPDRINRLVCWCTYARGEDYWVSSQSEALRALRTTDYDLFLRAAAHELLGWSQDGEADRFAVLMRGAVDPDEADRLIRATRDFDVSDVLESVACPSMVVHRRHLKWLDVNLSRALASTIPGARLVMLDGDSPLPAAGDTDEVTEAVAAFLGASPPRRGDHALSMRIVLFTDIVDHTSMMTRLGDDRGRAVLRIQESLTRDILRRHGGTEVKSLGDGFMAWFTGTTSALEAARELQRSMAEHNAASDAKAEEHLRIRIGMNAGEPVEEDGDLFGSAVILASRITAAAGAGEILVSATVKDLSMGKGFAFSPHDPIVAKGFDELVPTWLVDW